MQFYLAPLQGLTDWIYREAYAEHIGTFNKYFSPFIRVQQGEFYRPSQCNDILPANNQFQKPIPQFLGNTVESFKVFEELCLKHGYFEANINMGCPYPMVTNKHLGAGLLPYPKEVRELMEGIFKNTKLNISIKCRLGQENADEFAAIIPIFNALPLQEIIIHPRIGKQQYKGSVNLEAFAQYASEIKHSICYNGDITSESDIQHIQKIAPKVDKFMLGRGILHQPFLLLELLGIELTADQKKNKWRNFHLGLLDRCKQKYAGDAHLLKRLEELWSYQCDYFENGHKLYKQIKKCNTLTAYQGIVQQAINDSWPNK